ncbi:DUF58 domain-containing protein [Geoglobus ahangari]
MRKIERDLLGYIVAITLVAVLLVMERILIAAALPLVLFFFPSKMSLRVGSVHFEGPTYVGDPVTFVAEFTAFGLGYLRVSCQVDDVVEVLEGGSKAGGFVPGYRRFRISYRGRARRRGKVDFGRIGFVSEDIFLLKSSEGFVSLNLVREVKVRVRKVRKVRARKVKARESLPDVDVSKIGVPGTDFREIRAYRPGDPIKFINWKATARKGETLVNEFEVEGKRAVWIVVNTSEHEFAEDEYLESALSSAASLSLYFSRRGHKVALTLTGSGKSLYPDIGKRQFHRIVRELTNAEFGGRSAVDAILESKRLMMYHMPFVFYITSIHDDGLAVRELRRAGLNVKVLVVEGREYGSRLARTMKRVLERGMVRKGAEVVRDVVAVRA